MKKRIAGILTAALIGTTVMGTVAMAAPSGAIDVISREDGSGTRGAFVELFGIEEEKDGEKVDMTTQEASITNNTDVMLTTVAGDENSIGYVSLGSLNDTVKAVKIDGAVNRRERCRRYIQSSTSVQHRNRRQIKRCSTGFHQLHHER